MKLWLQNKKIFLNLSRQFVLNGIHIFHYIGISADKF